MRIDRFKLMHWMNARKVTPEQVARRAGLESAELRAVLDAEAPDPSADVVARLAAALRITEEQLAATAGSGLTAVVRTAEELHATRRPIQRAAIHFYNYYSMAAPPGRVAPVILDILCPDDTLPALNNGHLEPAITINLGPGDIHGRWGTELTPATWQVLRANSAGPDSWIVGDSYVEPSYCPHTYSLASATPARIVSYTGASNLAGLLEEVNNWAPTASDRLLRDWESAPAAAVTLNAVLRRKGYQAADAAKAAGIPPGGVEAFLAGATDRLSPDELRALGMTLGFDHRVLLPAQHHHDTVGKSCLTVQDGRGSVRDFRGYTVASLASAPELPDLTGLFLSVDRAEPADGDLDLCDHAETHYLVTQGRLTLSWREADGSVGRAELGPDGTAWIGPCVEHAWSGLGAAIKLGSGQHLGYLEQLELSNTFRPAATLRRGRRDTLGWGYESDSGK